METTLTWIGIIFCISQSAVFSGLNIAVFSITRLRLEIDAQQGSKEAQKVLRMREDSNFLLTTILWGNVGINVLLTLLSNSVMFGVAAFLFSTFAITFFGEIFPQAYFSRNALKMASFFAPVLRFYQILLYPLSKTSALVLDKWLGAESIQYFREVSLKQLIQKHMDGSDEIDFIEGIGAINFLSLDDIAASKEGEPLDPDSMIQIAFKGSKPIFPTFSQVPEDPFLNLIHKSQKKWIVLTDKKDHPHLVMDADGFLRSALIEEDKTDPLDYCHVPYVVKHANIPLGDVLAQFPDDLEGNQDITLKRDLVLVWGDKKRIITGSDILERLLKGINQQPK